ncbi:MAG: hypothetical protein KGN02_14905 [bacterium]|nr:hypothetical protein [bacterium]
MKRLIAALAATIITTGAASAATVARGDLGITSALNVNTTTHTATLPLRRGHVGAKTVWYVVTDASTAAAARSYGVNYAPSLGDLGAAALQRATKDARGELHFAGGVDFAPTRTYVPSAGGFPPKSATPGGIADAAYSPFVQIGKTILNAPILATGNAPFDVTKHTNTEDRVIAIDTKKMTVTLVLARGFSNDKPIYYVSTEASDPVAASVERATFVPRLAKAQASGEIPIGVVVNGPQTGSAPQGLTFLTLHTPLGADATAANVKQIMSSFNVLSIAPNLATRYAENGYSPLWSVQVVGKSAKRVTNYSAYAALGAKAAGFVVNCPFVALGDDTTAGY